jgi:hypothetical protein
MNQGEFTGIFCARPQNFAWFLGAGASRTAGVPTATDIIWDLKRRYYCQQENQDISRQDIQNAAIRQRIQSFMESRGFPALWADGEYETYFKKIFGDDRERQRKYLHAMLAEEHVRLSAGCRVLGGMMASGLCRAVFTTNFDSVVEKAVAVVGKQSLSAYHLEGPHAALNALNNEEFPLYCKLHGDFRYDSLMNLPEDLAAQNDELARCMVTAGNRFGFLVTGYSARDASVIALFRSVLETPNPFPHGLYWTGIKGAAVPPSVEQLLADARDRGVSAHHVAIETYDAFLLRLWRNIEPKPPGIDAEIRKANAATASIPLPGSGRAKPIVRLNALPIISLPERCTAVSMHEAVDWDALRAAERTSRGGLVLTKAESVWCWGAPTIVRQVFGQNVISIVPADLPVNLGAPGTQHFMGFIERAASAALARGKPVLVRTTRAATFMIADKRPEARAALQPLTRIVGAPIGKVPDLMAPVTEERTTPEPVTWAEALRVSVEIKDGRAWLLIDPDIWIWPQRARRLAVDFMDKRRADRFNGKYNGLLDAWIEIILGTVDRGAAVTVRPFADGTDAENPAFQIGSRTGFARRLSA